MRSLQRAQPITEIAPEPAAKAAEPVVAAPNVTDAPSLARALRAEPARQDDLLGWAAGELGNAVVAEALRFVQFAELTGVEPDRGELSAWQEAHGLHPSGRVTDETLATAGANAFAGPGVAASADGPSSQEIMDKLLAATKKAQETHQAVSTAGRV